MTIKCFDYLNKNYLIKKIDMPILDHKNEEYIKSVCSKHPYYSKNIIKIHFIDKKNCYVESLTHRIIQEMIVNDIKVKDPKMLNSMFRYFVDVFPKLTFYEFKISLYEANVRFNTFVDTKILQKTDLGILDKEYKNEPFHKFIKDTTILFKTHNVNITNIDNITYINERINLDFDKLNILLHKSNLDVKVYDTSIQFFIKGKKVILYKKKNLSLTFFDMSESVYLKTLDYIFKNIIQECDWEENNPFIEKQDTRDCQEKRQGEVLQIMESEEKDLEISLSKIFRCSRNEEYSFPGYTKKGSLCCFSSVPTFKFSKEFNDFTFYPSKENKSILNKEISSISRKKNIYVIDWFTKQLIESDVAYDVYNSCEIYLHISTFNDLWIMKDSKNKSEFSSDIIHQLGLKLDYPKFEGINWMKDIYRKYSFEIVDKFNNTVFLETKDGAYMPVVPQNYTSILPQKEMSYVDFDLQTEYLKEMNIKFNTNENFIVSEKLGIYIPYNNYGVKILEDILSEINNCLLV